MKHTMRNVLIAALVLIGAGVLIAKTFGVGIAFGKTNGKAALGYSEQRTDQTAKTDTIATAKVETVARDDFLRLTGSLVADEKSDVASTTNGIVKEVRVERGSLVEKGDVLAVVDPRDAENALAEGRAAIEELKAALGWEDVSKPYSIDENPGVRAAKAGRDLAKANCDRHESLFQQGAISKVALDQMKTENETAQQRYEQALHQAKQLYQSYNTAAARLKILQKVVADTTITAPFSGWVAEKYVSTGERVTTSPMGAGARIVSLVKTDPLRLVVTVPQQWATLVSQEQEIRFAVEAFPGKTFTGRVRHIGPSLESNSRSLTVEALVANADRVLRPGYFASAELRLPEKSQRFVIPADAIVKSGEVAKVYVMRDKKPIEQVVALDVIEKDRAYVKSGLSADDTVVTTPAVLAQTDEAKPQ